MQRSVITACALKAILCYYFEFDDSIISYESQPWGYYYQYEGERHVYTSDIEAFRGIKSFYIEIKSKI